MCSMAAQFEVTLYIHPDEGPIKPVKLNLLEVEAAVQNSKMAIGNFEEARMQEVCRQIKKAFPHVVPESNRQGIVTILARFANAHQFSGMVLRLNGSIEADQSKTGNNVKSQIGEVDALGKEVSRLRRMLEVEQQASRATKEQIAQLQSESSKFRQERDLLYDRNRITVEDLQARLRQRESEYQRLRADADKIAQERSDFRVQVDLLTETGEELRARNEALQKNLAELQARLSSNEHELARLRMERTGAQRTEKDLREEIKQLKDEIADLETKLYAQQRQTVQGSDQFDAMLPP